MQRKLIFILLAIAITLSCGIFTRSTKEITVADPLTEEPSFVSTATEPSRTVLLTSTSESYTDLSTQQPLLTLNNLNLIPPDEIIKEIGFFPGLGGCYLNCQCSDVDYSEPTIYATNDTVEVFKSIFFEICQPYNSEKIDITIELPNGKEKKFTHTGSEGVEYIPRLQDPLGQYIFIFSGNGWELEKRIKVEDVNEPRLYLTLDSELILYKFNPGEKVLIFAYEKIAGNLSKHDYQLIGWNEYFVDEKGELTIQTDLTASFIAIGEESGQVFHYEEGNEYDWVSDVIRYSGSADIYCKGAPEPVGIIASQEAEILVDILPTYEYNHTTGKVIETGPEYFGKGTIVSVRSNAKCYDGKFLWQVSCKEKDCDGFWGFVPEADSNTIYLRPVY